ncbi:MAG: prolyl-tRNA synthetase associated domain-containing protein [Anaerovoracaceae bacterium]
MTEITEMTEEKRREEAVYACLDSLGISYETHHHSAIFTTADAEEHGYSYPGFNVKNLVIKDRKTEKYYMVILEDHDRMDFKAYKAITGWSKRASFADNEDLMEHLGVSAGSCSVFGLINDKQKAITVVLSPAIAAAGEGEQINFHPNVNTATVSFTIGAMNQFLDWAGNPVIRPAELELQSEAKGE